MFVPAFLLTASGQILIGIVTNSLLVKPDAVIDVLLKSTSDASEKTVLKAIDRFLGKRKPKKAIQKAIRQAEECFIRDDSST